MDREETFAPSLTVTLHRVYSGDTMWLSFKGAYHKLIIVPLSVKISIYAS